MTNWTKTRISLITLSALALAGCATHAVNAPSTFTPGTYTTTVNGHNAPMTVSVTVSKNRIESIDTSGNLETIGVGQVALKKLTDQILAQQNLDVDAVTGATVSSFALLHGIKEDLKQAGGDMKALTQKAPKALAPLVKYEGDVVVIGGGGTGLAAALSAYQAGAKKVYVLEKLGYLGGSTNVSEGALNAVDDERQKAQGIEDSFEKFEKQTYEGGHKKGDKVLIHELTHHSIDSVKWLESMGVKFRDKIGTATGALWQRSHYPATPSGNTYIRALEAAIEKTNGAIVVLTDTDAKDLVMKDGRVTGVVAQHKTQRVELTAADGVIIATGGFGANIDLRQKVNTGVWKSVKLDNKIGCTNIQKAAQGEGMVLAHKVGADLIGLDDIQIHPCGTPGTGLMENIRTSGRNRLFVNSDGNRFVNEGAARDVLARAIFEQKGGTYWVLVNHVRYPSRDFVDRNGASIKNMVALGSVIEADTLDELAKKTGMNAKNLKKAVANYNLVVQGKAKDKLGFVADNKDDKLLTEGPWYACKKVPTVHHTMGGIRINKEAQVLNHEGKPIPGLFAAGEVTGGIHGSNRLGGNAIADVMTFGRIAGKNVVEMK